ncbi:MAG: dienelactone hydrolase family protein [Nitrospirae bacterium]|nr:dienelactone hydrolase family protein [Nitrospirota bacterium]
MMIAIFFAKKQRRLFQGHQRTRIIKNFGTAKDRFIAAMEFLKMQPVVDSEKTAAVGYCFGRVIVLNMARQPKITFFFAT